MIVSRATAFTGEVPALLAVWQLWCKRRDRVQWCLTVFAGPTVERVHNGTAEVRGEPGVPPCVDLLFDRKFAGQVISLAATTASGGALARAAAAGGGGERLRRAGEGDLVGGHIAAGSNEVRDGQNGREDHEERHQTDQPRQRQPVSLNTAPPPPNETSGESWPTAAIPMENPYCSCRLTGSGTDTVGLRRATSTLPFLARLLPFGQRLVPLLVVLQRRGRVDYGRPDHCERAGPGCSVIDRRVVI